MSVAIRADREGGPCAYSTDRSVRLGPRDDGGARAVENTEAFLAGCGSVDVDLAQLDRIDGAGAVLLARLLDRLDAGGRPANVIEGSNGEAARLIARYREAPGGPPSVPDPAAEPADADRRVRGSVT
jgi:phospholipid/cholesterol/gamma-HCH transport system permease protein